VGMMDRVKVIFFDMGNTSLHFHYGKSDDEKYSSCQQRALLYGFYFANNNFESILHSNLK